MSVLDLPFGTRQQRMHLSRGLAEDVKRLETAGDDSKEAANLLAHSLVRDALRAKATDIHVDPQAEETHVRFRIDGVLTDTLQLTRHQGERLTRHIKAACGMDAGSAFKPANARMHSEVEGKQVDLRVASAPSITGEKLSIRLLDRSRAGQRLDELGMSDEQRDTVEDWLSNINGMFLVAGPTGSGKTTTLYALLHELKLHERSVVTVEDPVEYQIDGTTQIQVDRRHGLTFAEGMRAALRLDPDYLLLGEIREPEDAHAAIEAAGSGRVLMSTIHSSDAAGAITALRNEGLADCEIAASLRMVVSQRLVRRLCRHCRRREKVSESQARWLASVGLGSLDEYWVSVGCDDCRHLGYDGRVGIFEVWRLTDADYSRLLSHTDERAIRSEANAGAARSTLLKDGFAKVQQGVTSLAELRAIGLAHLTGRS